MSDFNYGPIAAKAVKLIAKYGMTWTLELNDPDAPPADQDKPWRGPSGEKLTATVKGLVTSFEQKELNGERIKATDIKLLVAAQDPGLASIDISRVVMATGGDISTGTAYGATDVSPVEPGDTKMLYTLRLRQG